MHWTPQGERVEDPALEQLAEQGCQTCGGPIAAGYVNEAAGERCVDPCHYSLELIGEAA